jgi:hypothetical protein
MENNKQGRQRPGPPAGQVHACFALALPGGGFGVPLSWLADGRHWPALLAAAVVALTALVGLAWLYRARGARRRRAVLDAYAEREISRHRRGGVASILARAERDGD